MTTAQRMPKKRPFKSVERGTVRKQYLALILRMSWSIQLKRAYAGDSSLAASDSIPRYLTTPPCDASPKQTAEQFLIDGM